MTVPTRPVLRWHGGKWRLAPWILSFFPPHKVYVEPFGGAASVLLQKTPSITEVWNDLDDGAVNLFRVLREAPAELQRAIDLTPYARSDYASLYLPTDSPVESARRFVARSFMGQSSKGAVQKSGFDSRINPDGYVGRINSLRSVGDQIPVIAARMAKVVLEQADGLQVLDRYDRHDTLFFVDPPYLPETRNSKSRVYSHDLGKDGHEAPLAALATVKGMVILSGYPSPLYDDLLPDWQRHETVALADSARGRTEVVWLNPACAAALDRQSTRHAGGHGTPLFSEAADA